MEQAELAVEEFKGLTRYDKKIDASLLGGIFLLPLFAALAGAFLFVAFVLWVMKLRLIKKEGEPLGLTWSTLDRTQIALWAAGLISVLFSTDIALSLQGMVLFSTYFLAYFLVASNVRAKRQIERILKVLLISFVLVSAFGVFQFFVDIPITYKLNRFIMVDLAKTEGRRLASTMYAATIFGEYLSFILALLAGLFLVDKSLGGKIKKALLGALAIFCLVFTYSRGAYIGFGVSVLSLVPFIRRKRIFMGLFLAAVVAFIVISPSSVKKRLGEIIDLKQNFSRERLQSYQSAFAIVGDYPLAGTGIYTTEAIYRKYRLHYLGKRNFNYIHNIYFEVAVETGLIGLTAFALMLITVLKKCWAGIFRATDDSLRGLMIGFWMGFVGFAAHQMFDAVLYVGQMGLFFWIMMGLMASIGKIAPSEEEGPKELPEVKMAPV